MVSVFVFVESKSLHPRSYLSIGSKLKEEEAETYSRPGSRNLSFTFCAAVGPDSQRNGKRYIALTSGLGVSTVLVTTTSAC